MIFRNTSHASGICKKSRGAFWKKSAPASARHPDADFLRRNSPQMKTKPRVLLLSATSGAGHVRAAQALEKAFLARGDCAVEHIDALQHVSKLFQRVYDKAYISMVRRAPELMGVLYERTDQPWLHPRRRLALDRSSGGIGEGSGKIVVRCAETLPRRVHHGDGQVHGGSRFDGGQSRRADDFGSARSGAANGAYRTDSRPGRTQRGSFAGGGSRDSVQQFACGGVEDCGAAG